MPVNCFVAVKVDAMRENKAPGVSSDRFVGRYNEGCGVSDISPWTFSSCNKPIPNSSTNPNVNLTNPNPTDFTQTITLLSALLTLTLTEALPTRVGGCPRGNCPGELFVSRPVVPAW